MLVLFALSMPIPASLGVAGLAAIRSSAAPAPRSSSSGCSSAWTSFLILAVPLFILLGDLMVAARITDRLVDFAQALVGRLPGGLGHVSILANMLISGISGSGTADAAATGVVLVPAMEKAGYSRALAAAIIGAAATAGPIIPPSIIMIIYAFDRRRVGRAACSSPASCRASSWASAMMLVVAWIARRRGIGAGEKRPRCAKHRGSPRGAPPVVLAMPVLVVGGILGGAFTATESAAVAVVYALVVGMLRVPHRLACRR